MIIDQPSKEQIPSLRHLWQEAFGDTDAFLDIFFSTAYSKKRCRVATIAETVVAALYWFDCSYQEQPIAYVYAVATAKSYQGQGICHALIADTKQHLKKLGYAGILLVPGSKALFSFYEKMEFQTCSYIKQFTCDPSIQAIDLKQIHTLTYQKLREKFLPPKSVIQEKENLSLLETTDKFYLGSDFLLAAHIENDTLYGTELLGNTTIAPNIVKTFGCKKGNFHTPGEETAFAMYYSINPNVFPAPSYFGFAFD